LNAAYGQRHNGEQRRMQRLQHDGVHEFWN
jgi:hypothetical protein